MSASSVLVSPSVPSQSVHLGRGAEAGALAAAIGVKARDRLEGIQILRAVAIVAVVFSHSSLSGAFFKDYLPKVTEPFYSGVALFFVISGFVVSASLIRSGFQPIPFGIRRLFRLYPPIFAFVLLSVFQVWAIGRSGFPDGLIQMLGGSWNALLSQTSAILTGTLINISGPILFGNSAMWSLSVEFQFYAAVLVFCMAAFWAKPTAIKNIYIVVCFLGYCLNSAYRIIGVHTDLNIFQLNYIINYRFDFLFLGVVLYACGELGFIKRPVRARPWLSAAAVLLAFGILSLVRSPIQPVLYRNDVDGYPMLFAGWCFATAIWFAQSSESSTLHDKPGWFRRLLIGIGDRSYTIYLLHYPCLALIWLVIVNIDVSIAADPARRYAYGGYQMLGLFVMCGLLTEISYRWVEQPTIAAGQRILRRLRG